MGHALRKNTRLKPEKTEVELDSPRGIENVTMVDYSAGGAAIKVESSFGLRTGMDVSVRYLGGWMKATIRNIKAAGDAITLGIEWHRVKRKR